MIQFPSVIHTPTAIYSALPPVDGRMFCSIWQMRNIFFGCPDPCSDTQNVPQNERSRANKGTGSMQEQIPDMSR